MKPARTALLLVALFLAPTAQAETLRAWVSYGGDGGAELRTVGTDSSCPKAVIDGQPSEMRARAEATAKFPVTVCALGLPAGVKSVSVNGRPLPVPVATPKRILVIGDTGCRLKGAIVQACNDPVAWPFAALATAAAKEKPDLIIHVGDYLYRESPCPANETGCAGTPWGDSWATWDADFLAPATPLFQAAPWLLVRGNHEDCKRAGLGWGLLLSPEAATGSCLPHERPRLVRLGGLLVGVMDDSDAAESHPDPANVARLRADLAELLAGKPDWLLTHHPVRGVTALKDLDGDGDQGANATLVEALTGLDQSGLRLVLSGHIHTFETANYPGGLPPQLVAGMGGDRLDGVPRDLAGKRVGGVTITEGLGDSTYGYVLFDQSATGWTITQHGFDGGLLRTCHLTDRHLSCAN